MPNLLSQLTKSDQARLFEELNYMNLGEIRGFCSERGGEHAPARSVFDRCPFVTFTLPFGYSATILYGIRHQRADGDWKELRRAKAKSALETLTRIAPVRAADR